MTLPHARRAPLALALPALLVAACSHSSDGSGSSGTTPTGVGDLPPSALRPHYPEPLVDPNQGGAAPSLHLAAIRWGRLVDVYAIDAATGERSLAYADFVVGEAIASDGLDYALETLHGSQEVQLTILHPRPSAAFDAALDGLQAGLVEIPDPPLAPAAMVARNAAIELRFDDLLDAATITPETVRLAVGHPPEQPFEMRVIADPNHGDLADPDGDGLFELYPTRVIVDLAVSELDALESDPPVAVNPVGLPAAEDAESANARLRLPTRTDLPSGQTRILRNLAGNSLAFLGNGSNDPSVPTADVVRAFRSGSEALGDLYGGFLRDEQAPAIVGNLDVLLSGAPSADPVQAGVFTYASMTYAAAGCEPSPEVGDALAVGDVLAVVEGYAAQNGPTVTKLRVRVVHPEGALPGSGAAVLTTIFESSGASCFLGFQPAPTLPPNLGVSPAARVRLRFSEPMSAESISPFDGLRIAHVPQNADGLQLVAANVLPAVSLRAFDVAPLLPLRHVQGSSEAYYVEVGEGSDAPTDLAGNALPDVTAPLLFTLDRSAASESTGSLVLGFGAPDELHHDGLPEMRGQFTLDRAEDELDPRPVQRFSYAADTDEPVPSIMTPFPPGTQTPLVPLGSKLQALWRYVDFGWDFTDESLTNVDVEGLSWAPVGGQVVADSYDQFRIALAHAHFQPDEALNPMTGFPVFPASGLVKTFAQNFFAEDGNPGTIVHPKERGYDINPADLFVAESGKTMMPWPLNRGIPLEDFEYYTWRDTALLGRAAPSGPGVLLMQEVLVLGLPANLIGGYYPSGQVRSIGLPLLMEFRCYPDANALGLNALEIALAANSSSVPNFRAFSSGGLDMNNQPIVVDPDLQTHATGGFDPTSHPPGATTRGVDNAFYTGQVDLVTRISRAHSIWLPAGGAPASFEVPSVEADLPAGTELRLDWRGATTITNVGPGSIARDAAMLDPYGDPVSPAAGSAIFLNEDGTWNEELPKLGGASWIQVRVTFVSNAATNGSPALEGLGIAFRN